MPKMTSFASRGLMAAAVSGVGALTAAAYNRHKTNQAEADSPPAGSFRDAGGARLHYVRGGSGEPIVLIHGNGAMLQDWIASGVFDALARSHDVIAIDRPGAGYSSRPRQVVWTPQAQAAAIADLLQQLGVGPARVVGHSLGALVAAALALDNPQLVSRLILLSGYYFPTFRPDILFSSVTQGLPLTGDIVTQTVTPLMGRLSRGLMETHLFHPAPVSPKWKAGFPVPMMFRPSQLRASSADGGLAIANTATLSRRYAELRAPTTIVAGPKDKVVGFKGHSKRLHKMLPGSRLVAIEGAGHMVHYSSTEEVLAEIEGRETLRLAS